MCQAQVALSASRGDLNVLGASHTTVYRPRGERIRPVGAVREPPFRASVRSRMRAATAPLYRAGSSLRMGATPKSP